MSMSTNMRAAVDLAAEFPIKEQYAYFNHAGVAPIPASTQASITEFARDAAEEGPTNYAAWLHGMATTRQTAGELLNTDADNICFVHNTTHGVLIVANSIRWQPGDNVVGFAHEFPANVLPWRNLAERGVELRLVPEEPDYTYNLDKVAASIDARTRLLTVSWVEYATGVRNDLRALSALCRERGVLFCVDAIQGLGVVPVDLAEVQPDFLMADGHKWLLAPEGCGILYVRPEVIADLNSSMLGWCGLKNPQDYDNYDQPYKPNAKRFEEGSHNLMSIIALGASMRLMLDIGAAHIEERVRALTGQLIEGARRRGWEVVTPEDPERRAGIVSLRREGVDVRELMTRLQQEHKIIVAARRGFLRVSPHFYNDEGEIARLVEVLP